MSENEKINLVIVGKAPVNYDGFPTFNSFEDAYKAHKDADILYCREGISYFESIDFSTFDKDKTVSFISNDGFFPEVGRFSQLPMIMGKVYSELSISYGQEYTPIAFPVGPVVFIPNKLICKVGLPREDSYKNIEVAIYEWGCSQALAQETHMLNLKHFIIAEVSLPFGENDAKTLDARYKGVLAKAESIYNNMQVRDFREWLDIQFNAIYSPIISPERATYIDWCNYFDSPEKPELIEDTEVKFSILMPVFNPEESHLREAIDSVINQYYPNWELCISDDGSNENIQNILIEYSRNESRIKLLLSERSSGNIAVATNKALHMASGKWTLCLDHDDILAPHALLEISHSIQNNSDAIFFYSDEDKLNEKGERTEAYFKPNFDYYLLLAQNYIIHTSVYKTSIMEDLGGFDPNFNGSQDYDFNLRYLEQTGYPFSRSAIVHIPRVLYHWRQTDTSTSKNNSIKPYARENAKNSVVSHLIRTKQPAIVNYHPSMPIYNQVRFLASSENKPLVSIIIPTKDKADLLKVCLDSIFSKTTYPHYEILLIDTGSKEEATKKYYKTLTDERIKFLKQPFKFNWSAVNNYGAREAKGDYFIFLNNDTEVVEGGWIDEMLALAMRSDVGTVGARLLFADQTIQHVGAYAWGGVAGHIHKGLPYASGGYYGLNQLNHEATAVTGACMMVSKNWFWELDGFNTRYEIMFNDVEFCRHTLENGKVNVVCMTAILYHHESSTRGPINKDAQSIEKANTEAMMLDEDYPEDDTYFNPNLRKYDLTYSQLSWPPPSFFWQNPYETRESIAVINGTPEIYQKITQKGYRVISLGANDFNIMFMDPKIPNLRNIDTRESIDRFKYIMEIFKVNEIWLYHIGRSDIIIYRFLERSKLPIKLVDSLLMDTFRCSRGTLIDSDGKLCLEEERFTNKCISCVDSGPNPGIYGYVNPTHFMNEVDHFINTVATKTSFSLR